MNIYRHKHFGFGIPCFNPTLFLLLLGLSERLQKLQNRAARLIMNLKNEHGHSVLARNSLGWELLE